MPARDAFKIPTPVDGRPTERSVVEAWMVTAVADEAASTKRKSAIAAGPVRSTGVDAGRGPKSRTSKILLKYEK